MLPDGPDAGTADADEAAEGGADGADAASADLPPAPRDRASRKVGEVYLAPDGRKVRWTAEGDWEVVE